MTNCCGNTQCNRPFGLIRFSLGFEQFCSSKCRESYKRLLERDKAYWKWLFKRPEDLSQGKITDRSAIKELS